MGRETNYGGSPPRSLLIPPCCGVATVAIAVAPLAAVFVAPDLISSLGAGWRGVARGAGSAVCNRHALGELRWRVAARGARQ